MALRMRNLNTTSVEPPNPSASRYGDPGPAQMNPTALGQFGTFLSGGPAASPTSKSSSSPAFASNGSIPISTSVSSSGTPPLSSSGMPPSSSSAMPPASSSSSSYYEDRSPAVPATIGAVVGMATLALVLAGVVLYKKKARRKRNEARRSRVQKPFGTEAGFWVRRDGEMGSSSNPMGVTPFVVSPPETHTLIGTKSAKTASATTSRTLGILPPSKLSVSSSSALSHSASSDPATTSAQGLLQELHALRAQVSEMEALAQSGTSGSGSVEQGGYEVEPPPRYDASNFGGGLSEGTNG